ncbi:MAG: filamentous hemagglutinin N-terminal domain-containing protein, partial [Kamptonema sp. SIO4C4]|nr:filamentous hemagglutinin N-terminal domain-containing protein [Kamptonema sp. SIO4C4]
MSYWRWWQLPLFLLPSFNLFFSQSLNAQSITPAADGTGTVIQHQNHTYQIEGGISSDKNLFHSFRSFGLQPEEIAHFLTRPQIENILGRVTGGNPSLIQGLIRVTGSDANLFLLNPAGWIFTEGASLDVPGSFAVSTANRLGFAGGFFRVLGDNDYRQLTGPPTQFIFDTEQHGSILNEANLAVETGEDLYLVGRSVVSTGTLSAPEGRIAIAAIPGQNKLEISHSESLLTLVVDATPLNGNPEITG